MASIIDLPEDVIENILGCNGICIRDIVNLSATCKHLYHLIENNAIWRHQFNQKYFSIWPDLKTICKKEIFKGYLDFKELITIRINHKKQLRPFLARISEKHYYGFYESLSENVTWHTWLNVCRHDNYTNEVIVQEKEFNSFKWDETYELLFPNGRANKFTRTVTEFRHKNDLTNRYYGKELLLYMKHYHLKTVWQNFRKRPAKEQLLEGAATFVAQWFQPEKNISYCHIARELDKITQQTMEDLEIENFRHPIFFALYQQLSFWKFHNIEENQWNNSDGRQILDVLCRIFFCRRKQSQFHAYRLPVECWGPLFLREYLFVNYVLEEKKGSTVLVAIIFQSIARRLGIRCDLLYFPMLSDRKDYEYLLKWKPKWNVTNSNDDQYFYIDILGSGALRDINDWPEICETTALPISADEYCKINSLELLLDFSYRLVVAKSAVHQPGVYVPGHDHEDITCLNKEDRWFLALVDLIKEEEEYLSISLSSEIYNESRIINFAEDKITTRFGSKSVKHERFTLKPKKRAAGMKFAVGMIAKLVRSNELVSLEEVDTPEPICSDIVGKYFCEFRDTYYMPNEVLAKEYSDDVLYLVSEL
ncbi:uncharacterized protein LOC113563122 [Ooceraea biroi]|uniref:uncharacterized protein LOC113563122 n=1 Tax=Ooceraea biroi TaxID=2015173 RepID=UPI000F091255|nr:uncharacterized protein LOC113563122 [Ooceraea biroi]